MSALSAILALVVLVAALFVAVQRRSARLGEPMPWIYYLFFFSGFPALIYQIIWERALFALYGVNVESVTVVVTGFLLGWASEVWWAGCSRGCEGCRCSRFSARLS